MSQPIDVDLGAHHSAKRRALLFVELPDHVTAVSTGEVHVGMTVEIIALSPHAEYALDREGLPYRRPEDYVTQSQFQEVGGANFPRLERLCAIMDEYWQQHVPEIGRHGLRPAWFNFYRLKVLLDSVSLRLLAIVAIMKHEAPDQVFVFPTQSAPLDDDLGWQQESAYVRVIAHYCAAHNIPCIDIRYSEKVMSSTSPAAGRWSSAKTLLRIARKSTFFAALDNIRLLVTRTGERAAWPRLLAHVFLPLERRGPRMLVLSVEYNMAWVLTEILNRSSFDAWLWSDEGLPPFPVTRPWRWKTGNKRSHLLDVPPEGELQLVWQEISQIADLRALLKEGDIDIFPLIEDRLRYYAVEVLSRIVSGYAHVLWCYDQAQPRVVVCTTMSGLWLKVVAHAAHRRHIPVVIGHHGEIGTHHAPIFYYEDIVEADYYFVYGQGVADYVQRHYPGATQPIVVGAPMVDDLARRAPRRDDLCRRLGLDPARKIVIYVITSLWGPHWYENYSQATDSEQFHIHRRIIDVFAAHPTVQFLIKAHPVRDPERVSPVESYIRDKPISNCSVVAQPPFADLINLADAFIIDSPSTSLLQMAAVETPIYVFNNVFHWEIEALEALRRRAFVSDDLDQFCQQLDNDLRSGEVFDRRRTDDTFFRLYAVPQDASTVRTYVKALKDVISWSRHDGDIQAS